MSPDEIVTAIARHHAWILQRSGGARATLNHVDARGLVLDGIKLREASLTGINLSGSRLRCADLSRTDMFAANLSDAGVAFTINLPFNPGAAARREPSTGSHEGQPV